MPPSLIINCLKHNSFCFYFGRLPACCCSDQGMKQNGGTEHMHLYSTIYEDKMVLLQIIYHADTNTSRARLNSSHKTTTR